MKKGEEGFEGLPSKLGAIVRNIDNVKIRGFRWFQEKALNIVDKSLYDYAILYIDESIIIVAAFIDFIVKSLNADERKSRYYFPLIIRKNMLSNDYLISYEGDNFTAYIYDAVDDIEYIRCMDRILLEGKNIDFVSGAKLVPHRLLTYDIYKSERLNNKSSNSLTLLKKNEIIKTFRRMVHGLNPDLEMTYMLRKSGFSNVQDIRGYFLYVDSDNNIYTISMIAEYIDNIADMWQYTQDYLKDFLVKYKGNKIDLSYIYENCDDYLKEVKEMSSMIANMHIRLSAVKDKNFGVAEPKESDIDDLSNEIITNLNLLFNYIKCGIYDSEVNDMVKKISTNKEFLLKKISNIKQYMPNFGKYIRCHGDLHLEQILKTNYGYVLIDFEGEPTKSICERSKHLSPLKDVAGMIRSFNYAAYSAYFEYKDSLPNKGYDIKNVENLLSIWADVVTNIFIDNYINTIKSVTPDLIPDVEHFDAIIALYKLDKALFEAIYEVNNRPTWFKIPLKGIIECIEGLKNKRVDVEEAYYG